MGQKEEEEEEEEEEEDISHWTVMVTAFAPTGSTNASIGRESGARELLAHATASSNAKTMPRQPEVGSGAMTEQTTYADNTRPDSCYMYQTSVMAALFLQLMARVDRGRNHTSRRHRNRPSTDPSGIMWPYGNACSCDVPSTASGGLTGSSILHLYHRKNPLTVGESTE
ncbi:hypothetical protein SprV_0100015900 [Sparganum proliferum]